MNRFIQTQYDNGQSPNYSDYMNYPLLSLTAALEPLLSRIDQLHYRIKSSKNNCVFPSIYKLTIEESAAVYLYAEERDEQTLYRALNRALQSGSKSMTQPWFGFLKLFNSALEKLPTVSGTFWRGICFDIAKSLRENKTMTWGSVSSCSSSVDIIKSYLDGNSVLCSIEVINGKSIRGYTRYNKEDEVLLLPGTRLRVKKIDYSFSTRINVVHLAEICNDKHNISPSTDDSISASNTLSEHDSKSTNSTKTFVSTANVTMQNYVPDKYKSKNDNVLSATTFANGDRYEVAYKNGKKEGHGIYYYSNGKIEKGLFADNRAQGKGNRTWQNGDRYEGDFQYGKMHGFGILYYRNGYVYEGNWIADEPFGDGTSTLSNGNHCTGFHKNGKIHGYGTFHSINGDKYQGDLEYGKAHGLGVRIWPNNDQYEGSFENDKKHGYGTYSYSGGGKYEGHWAYDEMNGQGLLKWPSGTRYEGTFKNGKRHGWGKLTFATGQVRSGHWENDKYIS